VPVRWISERSASPYPELDEYFRHMCIGLIAEAAPYRPALTPMNPTVAITAKPTAAGRIVAIPPDRSDIPTTMRVNRFAAVSTRSRTRT
jgi:hypothetical protein